MRKSPRRARKARFKLHLEATTLLVQHPFTISEVSETSLTSGRNDNSVISRPTRKPSHSPLHPGRSQRSVGAPQQQSLLAVFNSITAGRGSKFPTVSEAQSSCRQKPASRFISASSSLTAQIPVFTGIAEEASNSWSVNLELFSSPSRIIPSISDLTERPEGQ